MTIEKYPDVLKDDTNTETIKRIISAQATREILEKDSQAAAALTLAVSHLEEYDPETELIYPKYSFIKMRDLLEGCQTSLLDEYRTLVRSCSRYLHDGLKYIW